MVTSTYTAGEISIGRAAEITSVSQQEMKEVLTQGGAKIHLALRTVDEVLSSSVSAPCLSLVPDPHTRACRPADRGSAQ